MLAHGLLRGVLAGYAGLAPAALAFECNAWGKPALSSRAQDRFPVHFNLSHTRGMAVLAVCLDAEVGVDVERVDAGIDALALADANFSQRERALLHACVGMRRAECFTEIWSLKEAWVKALGRGLSVPLDGFTAQVDGRPPHIVDHASGGDVRAACACRLYESEDGYRLAVAVPGVRGEALSVRAWTGLPLLGFAPAGAFPAWAGPGAGAAARTGPACSSSDGSNVTHGRKIEYRSS